MNGSGLVFNREAVAPW